jgi:filamentous hemagglutinin family protein
MLSKVVRSLSFGILSLFAWGQFTKPTIAQTDIRPDTTLPGESSIVEGQGTLTFIEGGATRGSNLFHSFEEFNIRTGEGAYFLIPNLAIESVFSRITGNDPTNIDGVLGAAVSRESGVMSGADLYLMNPNGVLFGPNATLNLGGSLVITTADGIQFENQSIFSAFQADSPSQLLTVEPSAFLFNQLQVPSIQSAAQNIVLPSSRSVIFLGGDVSFQGSQIVGSLGSELEIGGIVGPGRVNLNRIDNRPRLSVEASSSRANVILDQASSLLLTNGGRIGVHAQDVRLANGSIIAGLLLFLPNFGEFKGIDISIDASGEVNLLNSNVLSGLFGNDIPNVVGNSGSININGQSINLTGLSAIASLSAGSGNAGNVILRATDEISASNSVIGSPTLSLQDPRLEPFFSSLIGLGRGGDVSLQAAKIILTDGTSVNSINNAAAGDAGNINILASDTFRLSNGSTLSTETSAQGNGGTIVLESDNTVSLEEGTAIRTSTFGQGNAGNIDIRSGNSLSLVNGAQIQAVTSGAGNAGTVNVYASEKIIFDGVDSVGNFSGITTSVFPIAEQQIARQAGNINISTENVGSLALLNSGIIRSNVEAGAFGIGGDISITVGSLSLADGSQIQSILRDVVGPTAPTRGVTGEINIDIYDAFQAVGRNADGLPSGISTTVGIGTEGRGRDINVKTNSLNLIDGGRLVTGTFGIGDAGNILIQASGDVNIIEHEPTSTFTSRITSGVEHTDAVGNSGNITIRSNSLRMESLAGSENSRSDIGTTTSGLGNSGDINIFVSDDVVLQGSSYIFSDVAGGGVGDAGNIIIQSRSLSLADGGEIAASVFREENGVPGGQGNGGLIEISASDFIDISGMGSTGFSSGIFANTQREAIGEGGEITLNTHRFRVANGGVVTAQTLNSSSSGSITITTDSFESVNGGQVVVDSRAGGNAGDIILTADNILISGLDTNYRNRLVKFPNAPVANVSENSGLFATTDEMSNGNGGSIQVQANRINLENSGQISASSLGSGIAGNIFIDTAGQITLQNSEISTTAVNASGGNIFVNRNSSARSGVLVLERRGNISTESLGDGGNITLALPVVALEDSNIIARSQDANGGNITLESLFSDTIPPDDQAPFVGDGQVDINADGQISAGTILILDTSFLQSDLAELPNNLINAETLVANSCIVSSGSQNGSLTMTNADSLPSQAVSGQTTYSTGSISTIASDAIPELSVQPHSFVSEPDSIYQLADGRLVMGRQCL